MINYGQGFSRLFKKKLSMIIKDGLGWSKMFRDTKG